MNQSRSQTMADHVPFIKKWITLIGMIALFAASYGLDLWIDYRRILTANTFQTSRSMWSQAIEQLVFAGLVVSLAWYMFFHNDPGKLICWLYILTGLVIALALTPPMLVIREVLRIGPIFHIGLPGPYLHLAGAFVFGLGVAKIVHQAP